MESGSNFRNREALALFADELSAHRYLEKLLWPDGPRCPRCGETERVGRQNGRSTRVGAYKCYGCRRPFSVLHGTLMSASHVPAHKWLQAIYLTQGGTRPMPTLHRILNVSFKTGSSMKRRLELAAARMSGVPTPEDSAKDAIARFVAKIPIGKSYSTDR